MNPVLLIDFGSTYTKVTAVETDGPAILGTAGAHTTVTTDIGEGLEAALSKLHQQTGPLSFRARFACSSAAGGLRMVACGLVPSLTVEAAKRAALGAGAKVVRVFSYELTKEDIEEISAIQPDILLLTGGTDGGNRANIEQNASMLRHAGGGFPILVAGNRAAGAACEALLSGSGHEVIRCANVMPVFNQLNIAPVQAEIRALFLRRIIRAKGLSRQQALVDGILMPTPAAVMRALSLLSKEMGDLVAADVGGATTDIYSIADGLPEGASTILRGLPEPHEKRTVEGDIGMRYSAQGVVEAVGMAQIAALSGLGGEEIDSLLAQIRQTPGIVAGDGDALSKLDFALAASAIDTALKRHVGTLEKVYTPTGMLYQQTGKDLTQIRWIVLTGGMFAYGKGKRAIEAYMRPGVDDPMLLKPRKAKPLVDEKYILAAMGLLCEAYPDAALALMRQNLRVEK